jgi:DNA polymerase-4
MPLRTAARRCADAVFLPSEPAVYKTASAQVMEVLRGFDAVVEVAGWDEAFLDVRTPDPGGFARRIQAAVLARTRLSCSVGVGDNKLRAKLASGFAKPAGVFRLTADNWRPVMDARTTDALWGIGSKTARRLAGALGIRTVGELALADPARLAATFGPTIGPWLRRLARGVDPAPVVAEPYLARSRGREVTYQADLSDPAAIRVEVERLAGEVAKDVVEEGRPAVRIGVKVRFVPFDTHTHSVALEAPTSALEPITVAARAALDRFELTRPVRLLGVRAELTRD